MPLNRISTVILATLSLSGCVLPGDFDSSDRHQSDFHSTYDLSPGGTINVEGFNGSIEIDGWDQNRVEVSGTKYGSTESLRDAIRIDIQNTPDSIQIRAQHPTVNMGRIGVRYTLHVPREAKLDRITTSNGHVHIRNVAAASNLKTSNGGVRVQNVRGEVQAVTSNGTVELESVQGSARVRTSNGQIRAENLDGSFDGSTSNGGITVRLDHAPTAPVRLRTSNGLVNLRFTEPPKDEVRAETSNGGITLQLPTSSNARISATTSHSSISSDFGFDQSDNDRSRNRLEGSIGNGGPRIELSTSNGHIRLQKTE
jgi:hypothetical protein